MITIVDRRALDDDTNQRRRQDANQEHRVSLTPADITRWCHETYVFLSRRVLQRATLWMYCMWDRCRCYCPRLLLLLLLLQLMHACPAYHFCFFTAKGVGRILVRGFNAPLPPETKKLLKIWLRNGAFWSISEYICGQHTAVLYTCLPWLLSKYSINVIFACFRFLIFHQFFQGGVSWPHLPLCADAHVRRWTYSNDDAPCSPETWHWQTTVQVDWLEQKRKETRRLKESDFVLPHRLPSRRFPRKF